MSLRVILHRLLWVAAAAAAFFVSTGLHGVGFFAWLAPIPVLVLAFDAPWLRAFGIAFAAYSLGILNIVPYLARFAPPAAILGAILIPSLGFALSVMAARLALLRLPTRIAVFAFPAALTSFEFLQSLVSPHGTAGSLAYTQVDSLPLVQIASLCGIWGIVFLLTLVPSCLAAAIHLRRDRARLLRALLLPALLELLSLFYGWGRLSRTDDAPSVRVGLAVSDSSIRRFDAERAEDALPVLREYAARVGRLAGRGAKIVVLPEKFVGIAPSYQKDAYAILAQAARAGRVFLVAGYNLVGRDPKRNVAVVYGPDGSVLLEYDKARMLPGPETGYLAGTTPGLLNAAGLASGVAICKDMDFPGWTRPYARADVSLLLVPAWDFVEDRKLHCRMAVMRAVEGGFALVRCAQQGLATVCDSRGRIVTEAASGAVEEMLVADVSPGNGNTVYSRFGDWLGWTCLALIALILVLCPFFSAA